MMVLTTIPRRSIFDLDPWIGQRSGTFRFQLINGTTGFNKGEIHPDRTVNPTLTHDTSRTIKRQLSPLVLYGDESALVDSVSDRVLVFMEINGESFPLGRYTFTNDTTLDTTFGGVLTATLLDEMFIVDQEMETGFSARGGTAEAIQLENAGDMIKRLLRDVPITTEVAPTNFLSIGSWAVGTVRARVLDALTLDGDYFPAWCDNDGILRVIRLFDPAEQVASFDYDSSDVVIRNSMSRTTDLLSAPNRFIVVSNASVSTDLPVVGAYDVPVSAPHSIANRGFVIPKTFQLPVNTIGQADAIARNLAVRQTIFEQAEVSTPVDPRHDSYDIIRWQGDNWLELSWSLPLTNGGEMRHTLRKTYVG